jgi:T5SS/PEP-CTERM-associated repeat protein
MIVSNGASVIDSALTIGSSAIGSNNFVLVTGSGSVWSNTSSVIVGSSGTGATLVVSNGGSVIAGSLTVGDFPTSTNSVLTVTGGNLFGGGSSGELNPLIVGAAGQGTLNLNGGTVTAARLFLTNGALSVINFNSGQLNVRTSSVANAQTFFVGNGSNSATLNLVGNGQHSFANGLTVRSNSSVIGNGSISGVLTVQAGARRVGVLLFGDEAVAEPQDPGGPEERRRWARLGIDVQFVARQVDEWENSLQEGLSVAENISRGGALLVTSLPIGRGDLVLLEEIGGGFATRAEVVNGVCREDGTRLLNVRFLDGRSPDGLLGSD